MSILFLVVTDINSGHNFYKECLIICSMNNFVQTDNYLSVKQVGNIVQYRNQDSKIDYSLKICE